MEKGTWIKGRRIAALVMLIAMLTITAAGAEAVFADEDGGIKPLRTVKHKYDKGTHHEWASIEQGEVGTYEDGTMTVICFYDTFVEKCEFADWPRIRIDTGYALFEYDGQPHGVTSLSWYNIYPEAEDKSVHNIDLHNMNKCLPDGITWNPDYPKKGWRNYLYKGIKGTDYYSSEAPTKIGTYEVQLGFFVRNEKPSQRRVEEGFTDTFIAKRTFRIWGEDNRYSFKNSKFTPMSATGKKATVKYKKLKKKSQTVKVSKVLTVKDSVGTRTYKKLSGSKKIKINKKTGKVTVKKGLKKGTYKVKVQVKASGNAKYEKMVATTTFKIKVK